jgi:hypothetical protein
MQTQGQGMVQAVEFLPSMQFLVKKYSLWPFTMMQQHRSKESKTVRLFSVIYLHGLFFIIISLLPKQQKQK